MSSKLSAPENESLEQLLERLQIEHWDLLLVGDGSGCTWQHECGWGCVSIEQKTLTRRDWCGSMNFGTVNVAEAMAYLQPLCWYMDREIRRHKQKGKVQMRQVHILTDSSYLANSGKKPASLIVGGKNGPLWSLFKQFSCHGMLLHWHWIRRDTVELNRFVDQLSKTARLNIKNKDLPARAAAMFPPARTSYDFNRS